MCHFFQQVIQLVGVSPGGRLIVIQKIPEYTLQPCKTVFQIIDFLPDTPQGSSLIHLRIGFCFPQLLFQLSQLAHTALEQGNMFLHPAAVYKKVHSSVIT